MFKIFSNIFTKSLDEAFFDELEESLVLADCGMDVALDLCNNLRKVCKEKKISEPKLAKEELKKLIAQELAPTLSSQNSPAKLIIGVNGVGKTTTIAKLAAYFTARGKKPLMAAADTFRAAAVEQLSEWATRLNCDIVKGADGADPAAVVFDAATAAKARGADVILVDTAGRLHNKQGLMDELAKIKRALEKSETTCETWLVIDGTTGQNALTQAKAFNDQIKIDGIILTKLDSTAKGGIILAIKRATNADIKFVGLGEKAADLMEFDPEWFANELL